MSNSRRDSAIDRSNPPSQLQQQIRAWGGWSTILSQAEIDTIYTVEYGQPTQKDRNDFLLLFIGLNQDIMELQEELRGVTAEGADAMTVAPCFYGRLNVIMQERVEALANGKPLLVQGYPPIYPGSMMSRWVEKQIAGAPSLYDRIENQLATQVEQTHSETSTAVAPTPISTFLYSAQGVNASVTREPKNERKKHQKAGKPARRQHGK